MFFLDVRTHATGCVPHLVPTVACPARRRARLGHTMEESRPDSDGVRALDATAFQAARGLVLACGLPL